MWVVGYYDDTTNRSYEEEFKTEKQANEYMKNKIPAYVTPYIYDQSKVDEQVICKEESDYYAALADVELAKQAEAKEKAENSLELEEIEL